MVAQDKARTDVQANRGAPAVESSIFRGRPSFGVQPATGRHPSWKKKFDLSGTDKLTGVPNSTNIHRMNVLIVDDHPIFRTSLRQVVTNIDAGVAVVEAADFDQAIEIASNRKDLDLVLVDLMMPGKDPIEGLQAVIRAVPEVPVVVVSAIENRRDAVQTINLGAMGYIPKTADHDEFVKMLKVVLDGGLCLPRNMSATAPTNAPRPAVEYERLATNELLSGLTKRQLQVLALLAQGKSNVEIAEDLGVSDKTVRFYISAILKTLKVRNRTQAALIAARAIGGSSTERPDGFF